MAVASRAGSPGSTRIPAAPTISGQRADGRREDRHPGGDGLHRGEPRGLGAGRLERDVGPGDEPGEAVVGQPGRVDERGRHALAQGRSRERGAVVRRGAHEAHRGGQSAAATPSGAASRPRIDERAEERRQVLAGVEPARVHRVPPPRDAELRPFLVAVGQRVGPERGPRRERHDAQPVALDPEQAAGLVARGLAGHQHDGRVPEDPGTQPLAEPGGRAALVGLGHRPRREVQQRGDDRDPRRDGQRPAGRVVDGARGAAVLGAPAGPHRGRAEQQRVRGQGAGAEQPRGREEAPADRPSSRGQRVVGSSRSTPTRNANDSSSDGSASRASNSDSR